MVVKSSADFFIDVESDVAKPFVFAVLVSTFTSVESFVVVFTIDFDVVADVVTLITVTRNRQSPVATV